MPETPSQPLADTPSPGTQGVTEVPLLSIERGTCWVMFAYDIGMTIDLNACERGIAQNIHRQTIHHKRRAPQYFEYDPPPLRLTQVGEPVVIGEYRTTDPVEILIFDFGTVSVTYAIPLAGSMSNLRNLSNELYGNVSLADDARQRVRNLMEVIRPAINRPSLADVVEDYAIFQIESCSPLTPASQVLSGNGQLLAQILRAESSPLSEDEVKDALACRLSFGQSDLLIVDWNAAILFDTGAEDVRAVLEFANVELLEMRYLDDKLDDALDESYIKLTQGGGDDSLRGSLRARQMRRVAQLQVDSAVLFEGVNNALKLLGDQFLARVYRAASQRLHLNEWDTSIIRKLQTLESIYQKMTDRHAQRRMEVLEWIIIILIAISILIPFLPGLPGH